MAEHPSEVAENAVEVADHAAEKVGMPQIDFTSFPNQIFWLLITLLVIYFVLTRIALPRISSVLAERQSTITNDIAAADDLNQKAVEAEGIYNQALADARAEAGRIVAEARADIKVDLDVATSKEIGEMFLEAIIAPDFEQEALTLLKKKAKLRLLRADAPSVVHPGLDLKRVSGGLLAQTWDNKTTSPSTGKVVTRRTPSPREMEDLEFAWKVAKHVRSKPVF